MNALLSSRFNFDAVAALPIVESWRAVDYTLARWVLAHGGSTLLATLAGYASVAEGRGDTALLLDDADLLGQLGYAAPAALVAALQADAQADHALLQIDSEAPTATPFVVEEARFYFRRNRDAEVAIAGALTSRLLAVRGTVLTPDDIVRVLFKGQRNETEAEQVQAVCQVLGKRLFVLTGGPGTGKTTTVLRMLLALLRDDRLRDGQPLASDALCRIRLAAPTGKAAQRLLEALLRELDGVGELPEDWRACLPALQAATTSTVHRLLGAQGLRGYTHDQKNPVPADVVVVDEGSMVDLHQLRALLSALRDDTVLIIVGDSDQLTSVGTGSILLDVVSALATRSAQHMVRLRHCFRASKQLMAINEAVRIGDMVEFNTAFERAEQAGVARVYSALAKRHLAQRLHAWSLQVQRVLAAAGAFAVIDSDNSEAISAALAASRYRQLLCAHRETSHGAEHANALIEAYIRNASGVPTGQQWYPGRVVMITRNSTTLGLFNGDTGLCLRTRNARGMESMQVWFDDQASAPGQAAYRCFDISDLADHQGAFALTVHKSQGSEYHEVALLLPADTDSPLLTRQLLYTGLSRARHSLAVWGSVLSVQKAISTPIHRVSGLKAHIETKQ